MLARGETALKELAEKLKDKKTCKVGREVIPNKNFIFHPKTKAIKRHADDELNVPIKKPKLCVFDKVVDN